MRFHLVFPRRGESHHANFDPRRNFSGTILNWKVENVSPRGIMNNILEVDQVTVLVIERSLMDMGFLFNGCLERDISSYHGVVQITKRAVLRSSVRVRRGGKK